MNWKKSWLKFLDNFEDWKNRFNNENGRLFTTTKGRWLLAGVIVVVVVGGVSIYKINRYLTMRDHRIRAENAMKGNSYEEAHRNYEKLIELGDLESLYNMADLYFEGKGTNKDTRKGLEYLRRAATAGYSPAQVRLGNLYFAQGDATSTCVGHDYKQAYEWFMKAGNNPDALDAIGQMYRKGLGGLKVDDSMANSYFNRWIDIYVRRAEAGDVNAMRTLGKYFSDGLRVPINEDKSMYWYSEAAKKQDIESLETLSFHYRMSNKSEDREKAKTYLRILESLYKDMVSHSGNTQAMLSLSDIYSIEWYDKYDPALSKDLLIRAADLDNSEAKLILADKIEDGSIDMHDVGKDPNILRYEAKKIREQMAERGNINAMMDLGFDALTGTTISKPKGHYHGVKKNSDVDESKDQKKRTVAVSNKMQEVSKKIEEAKAESEMVIISENSSVNGTHQNNASGETSADFLAGGTGSDSSVTGEGDAVLTENADGDAVPTENADGGAVIAANNENFEYEMPPEPGELPEDDSFANDYNVVAMPDYDEAIKWFTMAAQRGDSRAMFELGNIYNDSSDFSKYYNPETAIYWLKQSADLCYEPAYMKLGSIYNTQGASYENAKEAQMWYTKAATEGDYAAQKLLAESLARGGRGAQSDMFNALKWTLVLKSYMGTFDTDGWFKDDIAEMEKTYSYFLTPGEVQKANAEAEIMRAKYGSAW